MCQTACLLIWPLFTTHVSLTRVDLCWAYLLNEHAEHTMLSYTGSGDDWLVCFTVPLYQTESLNTSTASTLSPSRLLYMLGSAETTTQHPIATSIVRMLRTVKSAASSGGDVDVWKSDFAQVILFQCPSLYCNHYILYHEVEFADDKMQNSDLVATDCYVNVTSFAPRPYY